MVAGRKQDLRLFLCGDVMTGRGIDQVLPQSCAPVLHEEWVKDARVYRQIAEDANGPIPAPVSHDYVWGDALAWFEHFAPDWRVINLETAITTSDEAWPGKGIHYRMHPANAGVLTAAGIDACSMANNHVLDWGHPGLEETLTVLADRGIATAGAGPDRATAQTPALLDAGTNGRVLLVACGAPSSGIPSDWAAGTARAGVWRLDETRRETIDAIACQITAHRQTGDIVIASIHWGGNWGYEIPRAQRRCAHALIDAGVDIVHGHSAHHPRGIEVYAGRLILYGCGDFLNDYEGIGGHAEYRPDLTLMYFVDVDAASGRLQGLAIRPMRLHRFRLVDADPADADWVTTRLDRESRKLGTAIVKDAAGTLHARL